MTSSHYTSLVLSLMTVSQFSSSDDSWTLTVEGIVPSHRPSCVLAECRWGGLGGCFTPLPLPPEAQDVWIYVTYAQEHIIIAV